VVDLSQSFDPALIAANSDAASDAASKAVVAGSDASDAASAVLSHAALSSRHLVLPNTIANVLTDHTKAVHDNLGLNHAELSNVLSGQHHAQLHAGKHVSGETDQVNHNTLQNYSSNRHYDHTTITMTAGSGLSGGGTIAGSRTFNLGALTGNWDAGGYQIRALKFYSDQATGVAPFTVLSTTKVTNLNADLLEGYHASSAAGNNTIVLRTSSGYIFCNYLNCTSGETTSNPTHYFVEIGNDSYLRQMTPANFVAQLVADGLMPKSGGVFTGYAYARDHGTASVDMLVNVCYGTGDPPAANTTTIGTLYIRYFA